VHGGSNASVIALAEFKAEVRVNDRIAKPGKKLPVVVNDIAIMQGNDVAIPLRQEIPICKPAGTPLSVGSRG
jgi:hypothetical protein